MTAYCVSQFLKYKGEHDLKIFISNNSPGHESINYLSPFKDQIIVIDHPKDIMHSHGTSLDRLVPLIDTDYFITAETDSFPVEERYLDYYENLIKDHIELAASILELSGGTYGHPCGALYKKTLWEEANSFADKTPFSYFPAMSMWKSFPCHLMVHNDIIDLFLENPEDYIELAEGYKPYSAQLALEKRNAYIPTVGAFHNGMGGNQEELATYGSRDFISECPSVLLNKAGKVINRMGYEPGQFLSYYAFARGKKMFQIPTETKWYAGMEHRQQEYTLTANGIKHLWGITSYSGKIQFGMIPEWESEKIHLPEKLYNTLPKHQRI